MEHRCFLQLVFLLQLCSFSDCSKNRLINPKIIVVDKKTDNDARKHEFPFIVRLDLYQIDFIEFENGKNITTTERRTCGASVIHKNWLLTAAHCVYYKYENQNNKKLFSEIYASFNAHSQDDGIRYLIPEEDVYSHYFYGLIVN